MKKVITDIIQSYILVGKVVWPKATQTCLKAVAKTWCSVSRKQRTYWVTYADEIGSHQHVLISEPAQELSA